MVTVSVAAESRVMVNVPFLILLEVAPSSASVTEIVRLAKAIVGVETARPSSTITKSALLSAMDALVALDKLIAAVSVLSALLSVFVTTLNVPEVWPAAMVSVLVTPV